MTIDEFEEDVIQEIITFAADWKKAQIEYGTDKFPNNMEQPEWWEHLFSYDRASPFC